MAFKILAMAGLMLMAGGCAGIIKFDVPKEMKKGKLAEDPPVSMAPAFPGTPPC